jgi:enamine deaminase RidA (YjgF/YER057c/UK114 family)
VLNAIAAASSVLPNGIDDIVRITKVVGFVSSDPDFTGHPGVVNGASELLGEIFGAAGAHVRCALGVASLPLNAPVEVEVTFRVA